MSAADTGLSGSKRTHKESSSTDNPPEKGSTPPPKRPKVNVESSPNDIGEVKPLEKQKSKDVENYYNNPNTDEFYSKLWGEGNIHFGYFPNLEKAEGETKESENVEEPSYEKAAEVITSKMAELGKIDSNSRVVDLGCGYGKPACDLAKLTGMLRLFFSLPSSMSHPPFSPSHKQ